ncbi:MAG TPA: NADH-quinone oxidoreductase subunit NuoE [Gammaproteobacteria bacterium]|nr:NADH-quinone oxidoreductase subunit NuoE [Gammaproteobacteria bacterium]
MTQTILSAELCAKIDEWVKRYPPDRKASGILQALHYAQEAHGGSLNDDILNAVADYLGMPRTLVYEIATFYTMYHLKPMGKHVISVCNSISCWLSGSEDMLHHLKDRLKIEIGETTGDKKFSLREVECLGACADAPMCRVNKEYRGNLTQEKIDQMLSELE